MISIDAIREARQPLALCGDAVAAFAISREPPRDAKVFGHSRQRGRRNRSINMDTFSTHTGADSRELERRLSRARFTPIHPVARHTQPPRISSHRLALCSVSMLTRDVMFPSMRSFRRAYPALYTQQPALQRSTASFPASKVQPSFAACYDRVRVFTCVRARTRTRSGRRCRNALYSLYEYLKFPDGYGVYTYNNVCRA